MSQSSGRYLVDANQLMVHLKCKGRLISLIQFVLLSEFCASPPESVPAARLKVK